VAKSYLNKHALTCKAAGIAVEAAIAKGLELGCNVNVAVIDDGGNLQAFLRGDGAFLPSITLAQDKAYTAAGFGVSTQDFYDMVKDNSPLRDGMLAAERLVLFGGGLPIVFDDESIGGIGVSGGSEEQDIECAIAGLQAIGATIGRKVIA